MFFFPENDSFKQWGLGLMSNSSTHSGGEVFGPYSSRTKIDRNSFIPFISMFDRYEDKSSYFFYLGPVLSKYKIYADGIDVSSVIKIEENTGLFFGGGIELYMSENKKIGISPELAFEYSKSNFIVESSKIEFTNFAIQLMIHFNINFLN